MAELSQAKVSRSFFVWAFYMPTTPSVPSMRHVTERMHLTQYWPAVVHACCQSGWSIKHNLQQDWIYLHIPRPLHLEGKVNDLHSAQSSFKQAKRNCRTNVDIIVICFLEAGYHSFALMYWVQRHQLNSKKSSDGETCLLLCLGTATTEYGHRILSIIQ